MQKGFKCSFVKKLLWFKWKCFNKKFSALDLVVAQDQNVNEHILFEEVFLDIVMKRNIFWIFKTIYNNQSISIFIYLEINVEIKFF